MQKETDNKNTKTAAEQAAGNAENAAKELKEEELNDVSGGTQSTRKCPKCYYSGSNEYCPRCGSKTGPALSTRK